MALKHLVLVIFLTCVTSSSNLYECTESIVKDGDLCRFDSIGYQTSFKSPNIIVIDFAHPLSLTAKISNFKATSISNEDIPTSACYISPSSTLSQFQIVTDISQAQLPFDIDFDFKESA